MGAGGARWLAVSTGWASVSDKPHNHVLCLSRVSPQACQEAHAAGRQHRRGCLRCVAPTNPLFTMRSCPSHTELSTPVIPCPRRSGAGVGPVGVQPLLPSRADVASQPPHARASGTLQGRRANTTDAATAVVGDGAPRSRYGKNENTHARLPLEPLPSKGSAGLASVSKRPAGLLHPWGAISCRKAAPLVTH